VVLAARGARETEGGGTATIGDAGLVRQLKTQATRVYIESFAIAVVVIAVVMLARGLLGARPPSTPYGPD
jgi:hypothetical protein